MKKDGGRTEISDCTNVACDLVFGIFPKTAEEINDEVYRPLARLQIREDENYNEISKSGVKVDLQEAQADADRLKIRHEVLGAPGTI